MQNYEFYMLYDFLFVEMLLGAYEYYFKNIKKINIFLIWVQIENDN